MPWTHETPTRVRFKTLFNEGYSVRDAARKLRISPSSAQYFLTRPDRQTKPPGSVSKVSDEQIQQIIEWFTGHFNRRSLPLSEIRKQFSLDCCDRTLLHAFERAGYHYYIPDCKPFI